MRVDARFAKILTPATSLPSGGPFASVLVPENLDDLYAQELKAISNASVPRTLDKPHRGLVQLLEKEQSRREKAAGRDWAWEQPKFDTPLGRRRLKLLNAIFLTLDRRGHEGDAYEHDGEIHARAMIGDTYLGLDFAIVGKHRTERQHGYQRPAPDLPAATPLVLRLVPGFDRNAAVAWQDDGDGALEAKIAEIAAGIIVAGEKKFRQTLREAEERAKQEQIEQEKRPGTARTAQSAALGKPAHERGAFAPGPRYPHVG
ncbi:hypothetical protein ACHMW7_29735 [Aminobacter sp. UC22_36]|uniref:hypothetical protein n=1 Tax=Aminobacter sp. UC22_36 TaxID=3374549 RepID=UPI0037578BF9